MSKYIFMLLSSHIIFSHQIRWQYSAFKWGNFSMSIGNFLSSGQSLIFKTRSLGSIPSFKTPWSHDSVTMLGRRIKSNLSNIGNPTAFPELPIPKSLTLSQLYTFRNFKFGNLSKGGSTSTFLQYLQGRKHFHFLTISQF